MRKKDKKEQQLTGIDAEEEESIKPAVQIVYVYSYSCTYCTKFAPTFQKVVPMFTKMRPDTNIVIDKVEAGEASDSVMQIVTAFPSVVVFLNGVYFKQLNGDQDENALMDFLMTIPSSVN